MIYDVYADFFEFVTNAQEMKCSIEFCLRIFKFLKVVWLRKILTDLWRQFNTPTSILESNKDKN
jgi:hypothetical protein